MFPRRHRLPALALLAALALAGCNDDSDEGSEERAPANQAVDSTTVQQLASGGQLGQLTKAQAFRKIGGAEPVSRRTALSERDPKHPNRKRVRLTCYRFQVKGGRREDFAEMCFTNDTVLSSVLTNVAAPGAAAVPGG